MKTTYTEVTRPVFCNHTHTAISCIVQFDHHAVALPFVAAANDPEAHGRKIFEECLAGKYGLVKAYATVSAPAFDPLPLLDYAKKKLNQLEVSGVTCSLESGATPIRVDTSIGGRMRLLGLVHLANAEPQTPITWYQSSGNLILSLAEIQTLATMVASWTSALYAAQSCINAEINAKPPTITTKAQIDAYNWPKN